MAFRLNVLTQGWKMEVKTLPPGAQWKRSTFQLLLPCCWAPLGWAWAWA